MHALNGQGRLLGLALILMLSGGTPLAQQAPPTDYRSGVLSAHDHRVPVVPDRWPWSSIGRVNVVLGLRRSFCTGTLIGPRHVITAAHCLFDGKINEFVKPRAVHFVAAQDRDKFAAHSVATALVTSPDFRFRVEERPRWDKIAAIAKAWGERNRHVLIVVSALSGTTDKLKAICDGHADIAKCRTVADEIVARHLAGFIR